MKKIGKIGHKKDQILFGEKEVELDLNSLANEALDTTTSTIVSTLGMGETLLVEELGYQETYLIKPKC